MQWRRRFAQLSAARGVLAQVVGIALALAVATGLVAALERSTLAIPDASPVYLVAVVAVALAFGTPAAIACSIGAFLLYDFLFIQPLYTFTVADAREWLNLLLFLLVAVTIGRLTALQAQRAADADRRAKEAQALFRISRTLATAPDLAGGAPGVLTSLIDDARLDRAWLTELRGPREIHLADTATSNAPPIPATLAALARTPGDQPARWVRTHVGHERSPGRSSTATDDRTFRIRLEADDELLGYLWATRPRGTDEPNREETRLLALAADQLALALKRDRLAREATKAEIARQSEALKSALLDSVSHDMRTPLASIRAAAGSLIDPAVSWSEQERRDVARTIDSEAERLDRIVHNLLDMTRIEGGALRPDLEVFSLESLVDPVIERLGPLLNGHQLAVQLEPDLPPVTVDAVYFDEALTNLLENAVRHGGMGVGVRLAAHRAGEDAVVVTIEDGGEGVPDDALPHLFEKFYRARQRSAASRRGLGIGLSVVKGLTEAMGGTVVAARSELGGLAVSLRVPAAPNPPEDPVRA